MAIAFGKKIYLLRSLFPSWKFFEDFGPVPYLWYRIENAANNWGPWTLCFPPPKRRWINLFYNPRLNYELACGSLLTHLNSDLNDFKDTNIQNFQKEITYILTKNVVEFELKNRFKFPTGTSFEFKITATPEDPELLSHQDVFISASHRIELL